MNLRPHCLLLFAALLSSLSGPAQPVGDLTSKTAFVDSLMAAYSSQKGPEAAGTSSKFLDFLELEGFADEPFSIPPRCSEDSLRALTLYWAGEWYYDIQNYSKALDYALEAMDLLSSGVDSPTLESDCANLTSIVCFRLSDFNRALEYSRKSLDIAREMGDRDRMSYSLNTLAGISLASRQPEEGEKYILEAIDICREEGDSVKLSVRLGMASEIYHSMGRDEQSLDYATGAYKVSIALGQMDKAAIRQVQMASAAKALGRGSDARKWLEEAMPVLQKAGNMQSWAIASNQLGDIMLENGDSSRAAQCFRDALDVFRSKGDAYNMGHSHYGLAKALLPSSPAEAASHLMEYTCIRDSLYRSEMKRGLNEYHALYGNGLLQEDVERQKKIRLIVTVTSLSVLLLLALLLLLVYLKMKNARRSLDRAMEKIASLEDAAKKSDAQTPENEFLKRLADVSRDVFSTGSLDYELVASRMGLSRAHLNRKVKVLTGCTTSDFILAIRISTAKELLRGTSIPVWEIALKCGFGDQAYFSTTFKKMVGCTPLQYRNS